MNLEKLAARANKYRRKLKNEKLNKKRKHKSIERKAIVLFLRNKSPDEILKYIESDMTRSIYYYPEQYAELDDYDLMKLDWEVRYNLWERLLFPPKGSKWELLSLQLYKSLSVERNYSISEMVNMTIGRRMMSSKNKEYLKFLRKIHKP